MGIEIEYALGYASSGDSLFLDTSTHHLKLELVPVY